MADHGGGAGLPRPGSRARHARREESLEVSGSMAARDGGIDPEQEAELADSVGLALLVVLNTLSPVERLAFVLHDLFGVPFDEVASIVERSEAATRQLASRARRRVRGATTAKDPDLARQQEVVNAFLAASRAGNFDALLAILDPDVVFRADHVAVAAGASGEMRGAASVTQQFVRRAQGARPALVDGAVGLVVGRQGRLFLVLKLTFTNGKITEINAVADPARLRQLRFSPLDK
jgi:RNA polymerase sigma-70 factor, ECF subfamily